MLRPREDALGDPTHLLLAAPWRGWRDAAIGAENRQVSRTSVAVNSRVRGRPGSRIGFVNAVTAGAYWQSSRRGVAACGEQSHHAASATLPWSSARPDLAAMVSSLGSLPRSDHAFVQTQCHTTAAESPLAAFRLGPAPLSQRRGERGPPTPDSFAVSATAALRYSARTTTRRGSLVGTQLQETDLNRASAQGLEKLKERGMPSA